MRHSEDNRWKGFILGVAGGVAGLLAMQSYWKVAAALAGKDPREETTNPEPDALDEISLVGEHHKKDETSTAAVGRHLYERLAGKEPRKETKSLLSNLVHWGYGLTMAGLYGALRGKAGVLDLKGGLPYAVALWALGDELMVPLLGLAKGPTASPLPLHAHYLGAHLAFGLATSTTTQALHRLTG